MTGFAGQHAHSVRGYAEALRAAIREYFPPLGRREFWATQGLIFLIAVGHTVLEVTDDAHSLEPLEFAPVSLFLIPVVYSGLSFGLRGSLPTSLWCAALTIPNAFVLHSGSSQVGEIWQAGMIMIVGIIVGQRIDRERRARAEAQRRDIARQESEQRYRQLFETTSEPIILLDPDGAVLEANSAAAGLFGSTTVDLIGRHVTAIAGREIAAMVLDGEPLRPVHLPSHVGGATAWVEPTCSSFVESGGAIRIQVILRDVTVQLTRQEGLEAYTRQTLATREEERRRIARDLHDGPVQSLVLLWRQLDAIGPGLPLAQRRALAEVRALAEQIADDLRRVSRDLRPSLLDDLGLGPALKAEVAKVSERAGIAGRYVETGAARRLGGEAELMLLRITQEALHNVERHAEAKRVLVRLGYAAAGVRLTVSDDGKGIPQQCDTVELLAEGKLGIVGMHERARLAGGEARLRSGRARGTTVSVVLPATA